MSADQSIGETGTLPAESGVAWTSPAMSETLGTLPGTTATDRSLDATDASFERRPSLVERVRALGVALAGSWC